MQCKPLWSVNIIDNIAIIYNKTDFFSDIIYKESLFETASVDCKEILTIVITPLNMTIGNWLFKVLFLFFWGKKNNCKCLY